MQVRRLVLYPVGIDPVIKEKTRLMRYAVSTTVHLPYDTVVDRGRVVLNGPTTRPAEDL